MNVFENINLNFFEWRKTSLENIFRYSAYKPMYYRSDVFFHSLRVYHILEYIIDDVVKYFWERFDSKKALTLSLVHDDAEIITWDILAWFKDKFNNNQIEKSKFNELDAINILQQKYPWNINSYNYWDLLIEIFKKNTIEAQIVKYIDHFDALWEAMHEIYAWNHRFINNIESKEFWTIQLPHIYYIERFNNYNHTYPLISKFISVSNKIPFLTHYNIPDVYNICSNWKKHTIENFINNYDWEPYSLWKKIIFENMDKFYLNKLVNEKIN